MRRRVDDLCSLLIPACILLHLGFAPYTKVEESFNIQATHDILRHGIPWTDADAYLRQNFDHLTFTGPVPRTFLGPVVLAGASWPIIWLRNAFGSYLDDQFIVRAILGLFNGCCMWSFRNNVARAFGRNAANWYAVSQASQFHIMYYASRTLPNILAFGPAILAAGQLLPLAGRSPASRSAKIRYANALMILTIVGITLRSEIAVLLACHTTYLMLNSHIRYPLIDIIFTGLTGCIIGLILTVPVDTYLWRSDTPLWPELTGFTYNIISGKSSNWGTSPWHFYFTSSLPRLLFSPFLQVCIPFALSIPILRWPAIDILIPNLAYIAIYSLQPHKEWRFIVYTIPPFLAVSSAGASWIWTRRSKTMMYRFLSLALVASTAASFAISGAMLAISSLNYPGAEALIKLHQLAIHDSGNVRVHMDTLTCMNGVTRFVQDFSAGWANDSTLRTSWSYDKTEDKIQLHDPTFWNSFDYALAEDPKAPLGNWITLDTVTAFAGLKILHPNQDVIPYQHDIVDETILLEISRHFFNKRQWSAKSAHILRLYVQALPIRLEHVLRSKATRGWWLRVRMEPKLSILKRVKEMGSLHSHDITSSIRGEDQTDYMHTDAEDADDDIEYDL